MYIFGIGVVWFILQGIVFHLQNDLFSYDVFTIGFGIVAGIFLVISNILLLECYTHIDVGLGSTIYRLNTVGVVVLSFFLLNEPEQMSWQKGVAIMYAILAIVLLSIA